jgi:hypothetical protein
MVAAALWHTSKRARSTAPRRLPVRSNPARAAATILQSNGTKQINNGNNADTISLQWTADSRPIGEKFFSSPLASAAFLQGGNPLDGE